MWDYLDIEFPEPGSGKEVYGGFYTQEEIRDVVAYATERHIAVMPEIEMPGHSLAALWSYPNLACTPEASEIFRKEIGMPEPNVFCAGKEETFESLCGVLDEVIDLFPSKHIHVGGDEVFKVLFENCDRCRQRMKDEGLTTVDELQSYFIQRMERFINSKGRILVGWDEILQGGLAPNAIVMSWRGIQGGLDAARAGHDVIMTPYSHCYFDFGYDKSPTPHVLEFKPVPDEMTEEEAAHVLGGQANLWTEYVPDLPTVHRMLLPRLASMSEILWSGKPDLPDFNDRLDLYKRRLKSMRLEWMEDETTSVPQHNEA
jgi:hexosaminidase